MSEQLITIDTFTQDGRAHICQTKLESEGIECFIAGEYSVSIGYPLVGEVRLQVKESDVARAVEILHHNVEQDVSA